MLAALGHPLCPGAPHFAARSPSSHTLLRDPYETGACQVSGVRLLSRVLGAEQEPQAQRGAALGTAPASAGAPGLLLVPRQTWQQMCHGETVTKQEKTWY